MTIKNHCVTSFIALMACHALSGCGPFAKLQDVGAPPRMTVGQNPTEEKDYRPVTTPTPDPEPHIRQPNSLWQSGARAFFKDQRAHKAGDIITVLISIQDKGKLNNKTIRTRTSGMNIRTDSMMGYLNKFVVRPTVNETNPLNISSNPTHSGQGDVDRKEEIELKMAAMVTQVLPNGNLVIKGRQEIRVNYEVREVLVSGIVRKEDILSNNTIRYEKIAEARISYGGRGQLTDVQQPPYGQQILDTLWPF
jgi:flagellar L-ring protein precursor FlgH